MMIQFLFSKVKYQCEVEKKFMVTRQKYLYIRRISNKLLEQSQLGEKFMFTKAKNFISVNFHVLKFRVLDSVSGKN